MSEAGVATLPEKLKLRLRFDMRKPLAEMLEAQRPQFFLWSPVFLALGIGFYFTLPVEPPVVIGIGLFVLSACLLIVFRGYPAIMLCLVCLGFMSAGLRTQAVYTPMLARDIGPAEVMGTVLKVEKLEGSEGTRATLDDLTIEGLAPENTPRKVRLRVRKDDTLAVGARISVLAKLHAPSAPVIPGGFDFRRYLYFQGIGAVGFTFNEPVVIQPPPALWSSLEAWRERVTRRIYAAMDPREGGVAVALISGSARAFPKRMPKRSGPRALHICLRFRGCILGCFQD